MIEEIGRRMPSEAQDSGIFFSQTGHITPPALDKVATTRYIERVEVEKCAGVEPVPLLYQTGVKTELKWRIGLVGIRQAGNK